MLTLSRMKSLLTLTSPKFIAIAPFSAFSNSQLSILRNTDPTSSSLQNRNFLPTTLCLTNSPPNCSPPSNYGRNRGLCSDKNVASGEIHLIVGPMFAGKTTTLLQRMKLASSNGSNVAIIKSSKDTRYGLGYITTHDGARLPCLPVSDLSSVISELGAEAYNKLEVIGIDEAQFFEDLYDFCRKAADHDGKIVIVAGLDGDYLRSFGSVLDIIPIADTVTKLSARCEVCGQQAVFTLRKTADTTTELIAGADVYMPVCRKHYMSGQVVKDVRQAVLESQSTQPAKVL